MLSNVFTLLGLASAASAHIVMTNPVPYGSPDNSPMFADGSNFPCKGISNPGGSPDNVYKAGSQQQLAFQGTAVHGGGSCQVSVTTDLNPTKNSQWKVIKSIEGGCPARDQVGNLPGANANAEVPYKYDFTIPEEMPEGEYVLAWTWFNKVGNREMYMNCASVQINGGSGDESYYNSLPDMLVANVGNNCGTTEGTDIKFPNPGQNVEKLNGATDVFAGPTGEGCQTAGPAPTAPAPTSAPAPTTTAAPSATSTAPSKGPTTSAGAPGGIFITVTTTSSSPSAPAPTTVPAEPEQPEEPTEPEEPAEPEEPSEPEEPAEPEQPTNPGSGAHEIYTPCSPEGLWNCIDSSSFQRCASGTWSAVLSLAAGTECTSGESTELKISAIRGRRIMRRSQRIRS